MARIKKRWTGTVVLALLCVAMAAGFSCAEDCNRGKMLYEKAIKTTDPLKRIELLRRSRQECVEFNVLFELGRAYQKQGDLQQAEEWFKKAGNSQAGEAARSRALVGLAGVYERQANIGEAITRYRQALRLKKYPRVEAHVFQLELENSKHLVAAEEIVRSLAIHKRAFGVEAGLNLRVGFEYNKAVLNKAGRAQAAQLGEALINPEFAENRFYLLGHTDARGTEEYNLKLSTERAEAVRKFLILNYPLEEWRLYSEGHGEKDLLYRGDSEDVHRLNRRVEVRVE